MFFRVARIAFRKRLSCALTLITFFTNRKKAMNSPGKTKPKPNGNSGTRKVELVCKETCIFQSQNSCSKSVCVCRCQSRHTSKYVGRRLNYVHPCLVHTGNACPGAYPGSVRRIHLALTHTQEKRSSVRAGCPPLTSNNDTIWASGAGSGLIFLKKISSRASEESI